MPTNTDRPPRASAADGKPRIVKVRLLPAGRERLQGTLFYPETRGGDHDGATLPAVLLLGGSEGGADEAGARRLAGEGYAVLALAYFEYGSPGPLPAELVEVPLEYFERALRWLADRIGADGRRTVVVGFSRGGELALLLASLFPDLVCGAVSYTGSGILWPAVSFQGRGLTPWGTPRSAWTLRGRSLPYLSYAPPLPREAAGIAAFLAGGRPFRFRPLFERALQLARWNPALVEHASIPVEKIRGPVLLISGGQDGLWPSTQLSELAARRLRRRRHPYEVRHAVYEEAGHLITIPGGGPATSLMRHFDSGGDALSNKQATKSAYHELLAFLRNHLPDPEPW